MTQLFQKLVEEVDSANLFARVATKIVIPASSDPGWLQDQYWMTIANLEALDQEIANSHPYEDAEKHLQELYNAFLAQEMQLRLALNGYPARLEPDFLTWENSSGWPAFLVLDIDSKQPFSIEVFGIKGYQYVTFTPDLPKIITDQYQPFVTKLYEMCIKEPMGQRLRIAAKYSGITPQYARMSLNAASATGFYDRFLVVAEAPEMVISKVVPVSRDPIIMGYVQSTNQLYFIDKFNPTLQELLALGSHTRKP